MEKISPDMSMTYGGEIETLVVSSGTAALSPLGASLQQRVQPMIADRKDHYSHPIAIDYDETEHIVEFHGAVTNHLPKLVHMYTHAITACQQILRNEERTLLSSSFHPFAKPEIAYQHVVPKPI